MKFKGQHKDFQGQLQAVKVYLKGEIEKLEREKKAQAAELLETQKKTEGFKMQLRQTH